ncbi:hypothetical protein RBH26_16485 [Natronolimnohabitans sp. A-GB9]|uniref:hypothetical protein n=1 Tax=Natronolimnohabitans sp. A-GB9 TaxID=3069757 RepID=UPI0027AFF448|nr:hypothetical protein [Natronolimnohabitans sp. A-GB9]MDQ2052076.1 hypothetical protein [Natronolimnohabitans sp. A-GB9]
MNPSLDAGATTSSERNGYDGTPGDGHRGSYDGGAASVIPDTPIDRLYEGSNGRYYSDCQVDRNLRTGRWTPCLRQRNPDRRLIETDDGRLLLLWPTDDLPAWAELRIDDRGTRVVDTRRPVPGDSRPE